jgi:hypothetical protein
LNKDKRVLAAEFLPALALLILLGFRYAARNNMIQYNVALYGMMPVAAFVLPYAAMMALMKEQESFRPRRQMFQTRYLSFIILIALTMALAGFLVNWTSAYQMGRTIRNDAVLAGAPLWQLILLSVVLPSLCEELFFRGALLPALEPVGFYGAMILSSVCFALIHGDLTNLLAPLCAGMLYCYLTYITDSVWSAVAAHAVNNTVTLAIRYLLERYSTAGLWQYFIVFVLLAFFIALYFAMGRLDRLVDKGRVPRIPLTGLKDTARSVFLSPGLWVLLALFIFKTFYLNV